MREAKEETVNSRQSIDYEELHHHAINYERGTRDQRDLSTKITMKRKEKEKKTK